jgi:hypothetical protein
MEWGWIAFSVGVLLLFLGIVARWVYRLTRTDKDE